MLYANFSTDDLVHELLDLRRRTGWPARTDGAWALIDRMTRAERELRMRGIDPDRVAEPEDTSRGP
jgi:hypothetical protein